MRNRFGFVVGATTTILAIGTSAACADVMPTFPDPTATETTPLLLVGLLFVLVVSGVSFMLLRKMVRTRDAGLEDSGGAGTSLPGDADSASDSSESRHAE